MTQSPAMQRFEALRADYAAALPPSRHNSVMARKRHRDVTWAAALSLVIETVAQEINLGTRRERPPELQRLRDQIDRHLAAANSSSRFETRRPR